MLIPAPVAAAVPIKNVICEFCVAKAVAKRGASVEIEPSMSPMSDGWTTLSKNALSTELSFIKRHSSKVTNYWNVEIHTLDAW